MPVKKPIPDCTFQSRIFAEWNQLVLKFWNIVVLKIGLTDFMFFFVGVIKTIQSLENLQQHVRHNSVEAVLETRQKVRDPPGSPLLSRSHSRSTVLRTREREREKRERQRERKRESERKRVREKDYVHILHFVNYYLISQVD